MKADLSQVTLCAIDCAHPALAARALQHSLQACRFADAVLLTDAATSDPGFRTVRIERLATLDAYSHFVFKQLAGHIDTPYVLLVQWDGYVVEPAAWNPGFLDFDYVGARWRHFGDEMTVGNGGFSLRSRRLLQATAGAGYAWVEGAAEDVLTCRTYRPRLSAEHGICYAPEPVAQAFSYEYEDPAQPTFGFHGVANLWRHLGDDELVALAGQLEARVVASWQFVALLVHCLAAGKFRLAAQLHDTLARHMPEDRLHQLLLEHPMWSRSRGLEFHEQLQRLLAWRRGHAPGWPHSSSTETDDEHP